MPIQVNKLALEEISTMTGIPVDTLLNEIVVDAVAPPTETKIKDILKDVLIMKKKDHETLLDNHGKAKFDDGKFQSMEQLVKVALGEKAFTVKDLKREDVSAKMISVLKADWDEQNKVVPDVKVKTLTEEKAALQKLVEEKESAIAKLNGENENIKTSTSKREKVLKAVSLIGFEATGEILSKQTEVVLKNILSSYELKIEDGKDVWYDSNGKKLVDNLQNPLTIDEIAKGEAIIFPTKKASNGRGDNSSNNNNSSGNLDAELSKLTTEEAFSKFMSERGLSPLSDDGKTLMKKWIELHRKKKTA